MDTKNNVYIYIYFRQIIIIAPLDFLSTIDKNVF